MYRLFVIDPADNVATNVADPIPEGTPLQVNGRELLARTAIPYGHKIALELISQGSTVRKYGLSIGNATRDIHPGEHVHTHNVESNRGRGDRAAAKEAAK